MELRFPVGTRVECCISKGPDGWVPGEVVMHWYRAASWPTGQFAPYQIKLEESGNLIFAPQDSDHCIRASSSLGKPALCVRLRWRSSRRCIR